MQILFRHAIADMIKTKELLTIVSTKEDALALRDIMKCYLFPEAKLEYVNEMIDGLKGVYPGKSISEIRDILKGNKWQILSTNPDPKDKQPYHWHVNYDGGIGRGLTRREERNRKKSEWSDVCKEAKDEEDLIEHYVNKMRGQKPWYERCRECRDNKSDESKDRCRCQEY